MRAKSKVVSSTDRNLPARIGGKYRPIRVLGHGGMSVVYEVEHSFTKERLALKVLNGNSVTMDAVSLARFRREARLSSLMKNEYIARVLDADIASELDGAPYLVMDLLDGADLATVAGRSPQPPEQVVAWFRHVARALDLAHQYGVVHRDLKPENLFLTRSRGGEPLVKVLDFGIASIPMPDETTGTKTGAFVGTPLFMSPEQASGVDVHPSADVWSVGMSIFRLLSGEDYWAAPNVSLLLAKIVYEDVQPPSRRGFDRGASFDEWFMKSCARDPSKRWNSIGEQVEALAAALGYPVQEIPVLQKDADLLARYESAEFDAPESPAERAGSLGGSVTAARTEALTRWAPLAVLVAFAGAAIAVALLFGRGPSAAPAQSAASRTPDPPAGTEAEHRSPAPAVSAPSAAENAAEAPLPSAAVPPVASARSERALPAAATNLRATKTPLRDSSSKKPAAAASTSPPASLLPVPAVEPRRHDPLADPD